MREKLWNLRTSFELAASCRRLRNQPPRPFRRLAHCQVNKLLSPRPSGGTAYEKKLGPGKKKKTKLDLLLTKSKKRKRPEIVEDEGGQKHSTHSGAMTEAEREHMERCMEKKAKLYDDLKKGNVTDIDGKYNIDWDRKHAEAVERGEDPTDLDDEEDDEPKDIKNVDEFGRTLWISRKQQERQIRLEAEREQYWEEHSAIPVQPKKLIYGDTIQTAAFPADDTFNSKMEEIRKQNDELGNKATHFDPKMVWHERVCHSRKPLTESTGTTPYLRRLIHSSKPRRGRAPQTNRGNRANQQGDSRSKAQYKGEQQCE